MSKKNLLCYEDSFYASSLAFWDPAFILTPDSYSANMTWRDEWILPETQAGIPRLPFDWIFFVAYHIQSAAKSCQFCVWCIFFYSFIPTAIA